MALPLLFAVGMGAKVGSSLMQGFFADADAKAEQQLAKRNAIIADQNAMARLLKARFDSQRAARLAEEATGHLTAQLGKSGARLDVGAPMALLAEQAGEFDLEQMLIFEEAQAEARQYRDQATMLRFGGKMARIRGKRALVSGFLGGIGSAATGYAQGKELGFYGGSTKK